MTMFVGKQGEGCVCLDISNALYQYVCLLQWWDGVEMGLVVRHTRFLLKYRSLLMATYSQNIYNINMLIQFMLVHCTM